MKSNPVVAVFDFDGTITRSDSLRDFVLYVVGRRRFVAGVIRALPWLIGMQVGVCNRASAKAHFLAATIGGRRQRELEDMAQHYASHKLLSLIRHEMTARVKEHKDLGHRVVLISASPSLYLKYWAKDAGFNAVLATELEFLNGRFSGRLASQNCWGAQKVQRLQQWFDGDPPQKLYAYGDSRGDREMLAMADHAWLRGHGAMSHLDPQP